MDLVTEVAIRDEWIDDKPALSGLKGHVIRIPVTGTLSQPKIDPSVLAELAQQLGSATLEGLLKDKVGDRVGDKLDGLINRGLDKLLKLKKKRDD